MAQDIYGQHCGCHNLFVKARELGSSGTLRPARYACTSSTPRGGAVRLSAGLDMALWPGVLPCAFRAPTTRPPRKALDPSRIEGLRVTPSSKALRLEDSDDGEIGEDFKFICSSSLTPTDCHHYLQDSLSQDPLERV